MTVLARDWLAMARQYDANVFDHREPTQRRQLLAKVASSDLLIVKVTLAAPAERAGEIMLELDDLLNGSTDAHLFSATRAIPSIVEVTPTGVNKGTALQKLCDSLGISVGQVLAFGDGENDEPLLRTAGYGVAMANAMPRAAAAARYRTLSNDEGGVGAFLERIYGPSL